MKLTRREVNILYKIVSQSNLTEVEAQNNYDWAEIEEVCNLIWTAAVYTNSVVTIKGIERE